MKSIKEMVGADSTKLRDSRVSSALKTMASVSEQNVQAAVVEYRSTRSKFDNLLDMGDDSTMDIAVKIRQKDPTVFITEIQTSTVELVKQARAIDIMVSIHNSLFPDNKVKGLDAEDIEGLEDAIYPTKPKASK